jgi:proteic killer suppression protein
VTGKTLPAKFSIFLWDGCENLSIVIPRCNLYTHDPKARKTPLPTQIQRVARRKLLLLHQARRLDDLRSPPGNRLEALKGDRIGCHSVRINDQWRICFRWQGEDAFEVEIVDYH